MSFLPTYDKDPISIKPGKGQVLDVLGETLTIKVSGKDTGGTLAVIEEVSPPSGGRHCTCIIKKMKLSTLWRENTRFSAVMTKLLPVPAPLSLPRERYHICFAMSALVRVKFWLS
jgi:hypothetical protein